MWGSKEQKRMLKGIGGLAVGGLATGLGASLLSDAGSPEGAQALGRVASKLPMLGTLQAGSMTLDALDKFAQTATPKKKKYY